MATGKYRPGKSRWRPLRLKPLPTAGKLEVLDVDGFTFADGARCNSIAFGDTAASNPAVAAAAAAIDLPGFEVAAGLLVSVIACQAAAAAANH